jgi:hypothetical protein
MRPVMARALVAGVIVAVGLLGHATAATADEWILWESRWTSTNLHRPVVQPIRHFYNWPFCVVVAKELATEKYTNAVAGLKRSPLRDGIFLTIEQVQNGTALLLRDSRAQETDQPVIKFQCWVRGVNPQ